MEFAAKTSKFPYPDPNTFTKFLLAQDPTIPAALLQELADALAELQRQARAEEAARRAAEEAQSAAQAQQVLELAAKRTAARSRSPQKKAAVKRERIPGKRMTFYVFQGSTYDRERRGGYIWAPVSSKAGNLFHHWDRLLDLRPGDIILHGCGGYLQAVSTARGECYDCIQPEELRSEDLWDQAGRRVDCDYIPIKHPLKTADYIEDILRLCNVKYAPFNKDGGGNMGYLYELNRQLARIFLRGAVKKNDYLNDVDYIRQLLAEDDADD